MIDSLTRVSLPIITGNRGEAPSRLTRSIKVPAAAIVIGIIIVVSMSSLSPVIGVISVIGILITESASSLSLGSGFNSVKTPVRRSNTVGDAVNISVILADERSGKLDIFLLGLGGWSLLILFDIFFSNDNLSIWLGWVLLILAD